MLWKEEYPRAAHAITGSLALETSVLEEDTELFLDTVQCPPPMLMLLGGTGFRSEIWLWR